MERSCGQGEKVQYLGDLEKRGENWTQNSEHKNSPAKITLRQIRDSKIHSLLREFKKTITGYGNGNAAKQKV